MAHLAQGPEGDRRLPLQGRAAVPPRLQEALIGPARADAPRLRAAPRGRPAPARGDLAVAVGVGRGDRAGRAAVGFARLPASQEALSRPARGGGAGAGAAVLPDGGDRPYPVPAPVAPRAV